MANYETEGNLRFAICNLRLRVGRGSRSHPRLVYPFFIARRLGGGSPDGLQRRRLVFTQGQQQLLRVSFQCGTALLIQIELRNRLSFADLLMNRNQAGLLQPSGMGGEVPIAQLCLLAQMDELLCSMRCKRSENAQSSGVGDQRIKRH